MAYILLLIAVLMWSVVGILVKVAATMVDSNMITFCRFFFGIIFLGAILLFKEGKIRVNWQNKWIWIAVLGKIANYVFENIGLTMGSVYGNIVVMPVQAVFLAIVATLLLKEEMYFRKIVALVLCIIGVILVGGKGASLQEFLADGSIPLLLFILAGIGAGAFILCQKMLAHEMDPVEMNFSVFFISSLITVIPLPFTQTVVGDFSFKALGALVALGLITGVSFYINSLVLKKLPLLITGVFGNTSVLFTLLWVTLFFDDPINGYVLTGAFIFVLGIILINLPKKFMGKKI